MLKQHSGFILELSYVDHLAMIVGFMFMLIILIILTILLIDAILFTIGYIRFQWKSASANNQTMLRKLRMVGFASIQIPFSRLWGDHRTTTELHGNYYNWNIYFKYTERRYTLSEGMR